MAEDQPRIAGKFVKRDAGGIEGSQGGDGSDTRSAIEVADPAGASSPAVTSDIKSGDGAKRGRGRPRGEAKPAEKTAKGEKREALDVAFLGKALLGVHKALAVVSKIPELEIDESESRMLAEASANLMAEYGIAITPKQKAWAQFYGALSCVYGTRIAVFAFRAKKPRAPQEAVPAKHNGINPAPSFDAQPYPVM